MAKQEVPLQTLEQYLPIGSYAYVHEYLIRYGIHLTISKERTTILGDYRPAVHQEAHRISVNGNLNPYAFLITPLHEMAHLLVYEQYGSKVIPHGVEWKKIYAQLLNVFLDKKIFPNDIEYELLQTIQGPAATSCGEEQLMRVLQKYDRIQEGHLRVEQILVGELFKTPDGRVFRKGQKLRKRHQAIEISRGAVYLFSGIYLVKKIS